MEKTRLLDFISRYHLGGEVEATVWETNDNSLLTKFISGDKSMIGDVTINNFNSLEDKIELGILTTSQLIKLLSVPGDDISLKLNKVDVDDEVKYVSVNASDNRDNVTYMLADLSVIHRSKGLKQEPKYNLKFNLTEEFVDKYLKAKAALSETKIFTILKNKDKEYEVIIGYSQINTNRVNLNVELASSEKDIERPISFNADYFKNILVANKDAKLMTLEISEEGLAHVHVEDGDYVANYYLVEAETDA